MWPGGSKKPVYAALAANLAIALTKFAAAALSGSSAMWSESIHLLVDSGNQALLLYGMHRRAPRVRHRCWPLALGGRASLEPGEITNPYVNYLVLAIAMAMEGASWLITYQQFGRMRGSRSIVDAVRHGKDPTVIAVLFEDSAALASLAVAASGVALYHVACIRDQGPADRRGREPRGGRRDHTPCEAVSLDIACDVSRNRAHAVVDELDETIKKTDPRVKRVFIESRTERR